MPEKRRLTIIATPSQAGQQLVDMIRGLVSRTGLDLQVDAIAGVEPMDYQTICACDDIVVLDATIESDGRHNYGATIPMHHDHVLVVSRSYLPTNFFGVREGGAPKYPHAQTNADIVRWLEPHLRDLWLHPRPGKPQRSAWGIKKLWHSMAEQRRGVQLRRERLAAQKWSFVSYRSGVHKDVENLQHLVDRGEIKGLAGNRIFYFKPGELVFERELLSPVRRWQIMAQIDDFIIAARSFLIYATPDYLLSWWTQGEISSLLQGFDDLQVESIQILDPQTNQAHDVPRSSLPVMQEQWKRRRARWTANSHPYMMSPHSRRIAEIYRELPLISQIPYVHDEVWGESFQDHLLVNCEACRQRILSRQGLPATAETIVRQLPRIDLEKFVFDHREPWFFAAALEEVEQAAATGTPLTCPSPGCGKRVSLEKYPPRYAYDFSPRETPFGPAGGHLTEHPVYCWSL